MSSATKIAAVLMSRKGSPPPGGEWKIAALILWPFFVAWISYLLQGLPWSDAIALVLATILSALIWRIK